MLKNYFKTGWRNLVRNKAFTVINISGLAMGMAVALLIGIWVHDEVSYNSSFINKGRIAAVLHHLTFGEKKLTVNSVPHPVGQKLKSSYGDFEEVVMTGEPREYILQHGGNRISKTGLFVEPAFTSVFAPNILEGSGDISGLHSILLSKSLADALVGEHAAGKMIKYDNRDNLLITGVFEDFPANSDFTSIKMLLPLDYYFSFNEGTKEQKDSWDDYSFICYALLNPNAKVEEAGAKIKSLLFDNSTDAGKTLKPEGLLFPMEDWHLYNTYDDGSGSGMNRIRLVWMIASIGGFILILACINFTNLSTARSEKRCREIGIRKVMGSVRQQLIQQFLTESFLVVLGAFVISVGIVAFALPWFNSLTDKTMQIPWTHVYFWGISVAFILLTSLLAGSYPALFLSSFHPVKVLKAAVKTERHTVAPRKVLVVFQFAISIGLIIVTFIVFQQIQHAKNRPVGFDREGIIQVNMGTEALINANYNSLRADLLATGVVEDMAKSDFPITGSMAAEASLSWPGKDPGSQPLIALNGCTHDFPKTNGFEFLEGRDFSREFVSDSMALIVNEMAAKLFSGKSAIGTKIKFGSGKEREIIGVIKDQIRWSPYASQSPHLYFIRYDGIKALTVRLMEGVNTREAVSKIEHVIRKYDEGAPFDYKFQDDDYDRLFRSEERMGTLAGVFSGLAIFISCIGIFGLAAFAASQRTKEIGIRKVLGATVFQVWKLLSRDFAGLVMASIVVAVPVSWYFARQWLQQYEYRIEVSAWVFLFAGVGAMIITLLTISFQSIKAALEDPVKSLRSE